MNKPLPLLTLKKTRVLFVCHLPHFANEFSLSFGQYHVKRLSEAQSDLYLYNMLTTEYKEELPYAIIINQSLLQKDNYGWLRAFNKRRELMHIPLIAILNDDNKDIIPALLQNGVDDCYTSTHSLCDIGERIEFLRLYKPQIVESRQLTNQDSLHIKTSFAKRVMDVLITIPLLILLAPIFLLVALIIRLESKGPVVYRSQRSGMGYRIFDFLKFRSMYIDADKQLVALSHLNQYGAPDAVFKKINDDPRVTRVGRFIRKYSIDELPQLINVLKGDMSIVGNRPLPLYEAELLTKEDAAYRFLAPAGITGLWQVTKRGKNEMSQEERISLDVTYSKKNSFWFDLFLLLKTPFAIVQKENV